MEQIKIQLDQAIDEFNLNSIAYKEVFFKIRELNKQLAECEAKSKKLEKIIQDYKDIIDYGNLDSTPGYSELTQQEQNLIVTGMDKKYYTQYGSIVPRFCDLEQLVQQVLDFKVKYPGWVLQSIIKSGFDTTIDTIPPKNYYKFTYLSPHGDNFIFEK